MSIYREFERLINFGLKNELFEKEDKIFMRNSLIDLFKLDEYMESKNINLTPTVESWTNEMMVELVKKGIGIGYFIKNLIISQNDSDNFEIIEFDDNLPDVDICCVYIDDFLTAASSKFIELLTNKSDVD